MKDKKKKGFLSSLFNTSSNCGCGVQIIEEKEEKKDKDPSNSDEI